MQSQSTLSVSKPDISSSSVPQGSTVVQKLLKDLLLISLQTFRLHQVFLVYLFEEILFLLFSSSFGCGICFKRLIFIFCYDEIQFQLDFFLLLRGHICCFDINKRNISQSFVCGLFREINNQIREWRGIVS